ncbi:MAG: mannitol dehydrogenase family protein, partial [Pseudomonadota bacterium]
MNKQTSMKPHRTTYDRDACRIGIIHIGFGAFHRAHQAVYVDDFMEKSGDLNWGIAAVNLRAEDSGSFSTFADQKSPFLLKTTTPGQITQYREIRPHIRFEDWAKDPQQAENLAILASVRAISITVTESGYYFNDQWELDADNPVIKNEIAGGERKSVYAYLSGALERRMDTINEPVTILCC